MHSRRKKHEKWKGKQIKRTPNKGSPAGTVGCCTVCTMHHICEEELRDETGQYIKLSVIANTAQLLQISLQFADLLTDSNVALRYSMVYIYS